MLCFYFVGVLFVVGEVDVLWLCNLDNKYIVYFFEMREIWLYGSGYGGNALLGKKCFALCIVLVMVCDDGWLVEHMLILKFILLIKDVCYVVVVFFLVCGKMNLVMLVFMVLGWEV